ncbi:MAG: BON domain-containing protein [Proteobacteria bacterium]|nr:BON domain-containing protein [Pseudomonadota bacterium]MBU4470361.1 BON domain-containing protein [Pseudomonadota bacterium]MCG2752772.1 BON domain-containing protein [Desulfobacteraceae bacterium]
MKKSLIFILMASLVSLFLINVSVFATETDNRIESSTKDTYVFKTYLKDDDIKIQSKEGAVTLTGTVSQDSHKSLAGETVSNLPGVKSVDNKLEIKGERPAELSDTWILTKVKTTLLFHRSVSGFATNVDVKDGVVTLKGEATSKAQKDLATEYANDVEGVKAVNNVMTVAVAPVKPAGKTTSEKMDDVVEAFDDASITALVKTTLLYHRSTSGLKTTVETKEGVVTLSGKAKNVAEKDLAAKLASDVHGVKSVTNLMTAE